MLTHSIVPLSDTGVAVFVGVGCFMLFLAFGINSGFGWCRVLFLVLSVLGIPLAIIGLVLVIRSGNEIAIPDVVRIGLSIIELFLLSPPSVGRWYRAKAEGNAE